MKVAVAMGYKEYVFDLEDALKFIEVLSKAELYKRDYVDGKTTHSITKASGGDEEITTLRVFSDDFYRMACLAGNK